MANKPHHDAEPDARMGNGETEFKFKPRAFNIVWGNDSRYWRIPSRSLSSNNAEQVAELVQVSWLEVTGSVTLQYSSSYEISFKLSFKGNATGWTETPVFLMAKVGKKGRYEWRKLKELENIPTQPIQVPNINEPFIVKVPSPTEKPDSKLYFGLYEVWSGKWKKGLRVHEAIVRKIVEPTN